MNDVMEYVENAEESEFFPTPQVLVARMYNKADWDRVRDVLEPSAGKGDIVKYIAREMYEDRYKNDRVNVDAIEIDPNLRSILKYNFSEDREREIEDQVNKIKEEIESRYGGRHSDENFEGRWYCYKDGNRIQFSDDENDRIKKCSDELKGFFSDGIHIVHDDFLSYTNYKKYDLIIMNPPFSDGDLHLLKALEMQKSGGQIVCLLNAETIRNPYTERRKTLVKLLDEYDAEIEYISGGFRGAERRTDVEVALIHVDIPVKDEGESIFDRMAKAKNYEEPDAQECTELEVSDFIKAVVNRYRVEVEAGIELIKTYNRMLPHLRATDDEKEEYSYRESLLKLVGRNDREATINGYVKSVRLKYWQMLLNNRKFIGKLTSKLQQEYRERVNSFAEYDFSEYNIYTLLTEMSSRIKSGVEEQIMEMYDKLTAEHSYLPETKNNRWLYDGWKTNKSYKLGKKSILPCYGVFDSWSGKPRSYEAYNLLIDIERIFNYFQGDLMANIDLAYTLDYHFSNGITKKIPCKFFNVTFYKKGTVHIEFTCPELIDRFNIYAAQNRNWLPPVYGKKHYEEMTEEEKTAVDSFQGKDAYEKIMSDPGYYLAPPATNKGMLLLEAADAASEERDAA